MEKPHTCGGFLRRQSSVPCYARTRLQIGNRRICHALAWLSRGTNTELLMGRNVSQLPRNRSTNYCSGCPTWFFPRDYPRMSNVWKPARIRLYPRPGWTFFRQTWPDLTPQFAKRDNVVVGWEKRQELLAYGCPRSSSWPLLLDQFPCSKSCRCKS